MIIIMDISKASKIITLSTRRAIGPAASTRQPLLLLRGSVERMNDDDLRRENGQSYPFL